MYSRQWALAWKSWPFACSWETAQDSSDVGRCKPRVEWSIPYPLNNAGTTGILHGCASGKQISLLGKDVAQSDARSSGGEPSNIAVETTRPGK